MNFIAEPIFEPGLSMKSVFVSHKKCDKLVPFNRCSRGQLVYVEVGASHLILQNKAYVIPPRHYFWVPADIEFSLRASSSVSYFSSLCFYTDDDTKNEFYQRFGIYPMKDLLLEMIRFAEKRAGFISENSQDFLFLKVIKDILPEISTSVLPMALPCTENKRMLEITGYIRNNLSEYHTLNSISERFGFSNRSLSRFFQATLNISFLQYLKLLRVSMAFELILKNEYALADIAFLTGYQSLSSFSNTFYQLTNYRPSEING